MNDVERYSDNPYAGQAREVATAHGGTVQTESNRAVSEVQAQVVMARRFPRDPVQASDRILSECDRYSLAEKAVYTYPRGGQQVSGPSIRLAESIARSWGNMSFGIVEVERQGDESSMLAYAWDLETNVMSRKEFKVSHARDTRAGRKVLTDERDIYEMTANQGARRLRTCILSLVPGDVVDSAVSRCAKTMTANIGDIVEAIKKMVMAFESMGISRLQIEKRLRHRIDATNAAEIVSLRTIYQSIVDGMGLPADYFEAEEKAEQPTTQALDPSKSKTQVKAEAIFKKPEAAPVQTPARATANFPAMAPALKPTETQDGELIY